MRAIVLDRHAPIEQGPLRMADVDKPRPGRGQVVVKVGAVGVCRSNLHMIEGDWPGVPPRFPMIPGHEVAGRIEEVGEGVGWLRVGDRVGAQPIWSTCGHCEYCLTGRDNLCRSKEITGETVDGGYAEYMLATAAHTYLLPDSIDDVEAAPLFCPGITAYGSVLKADLGPGKRVSVFGIGGVGHLVLQMARLYGADVVAVSRGTTHLSLAEELGAVRMIDASRSDPGEELARSGGVDASIVFAPSSASVAQAVQGTKPGGTVVIGVNAEIGRLPFAEEKTVVGSLLGTRQQMREVLVMAGAGKIRAVCESHPLEEAQETLARLKRGEIRGRAVLTP
ncbi:MAG: alcohol dehydrogenase catalytic domain-containing protein [Actinomycetes bacterium]